MSSKVIYSNVPVYTLPWAPVKGYFKQYLCMPVKLTIGSAGFCLHNSVSPFSNVGVTVLVR